MAGGSGATESDPQRHRDGPEVSTGGAAPEPPHSGWGGPYRGPMTDDADGDTAESPSDTAADPLRESSLPAGWRLWSDADDRTVLVYRPDVFDGGEFPAPCLPTIYVTHGRRNRRPGVERSARPGASWVVTLYLEPDVSAPEDLYDSRSAALAGARDLADRFARGHVDHHGLYQVPRDAYLAKLDELTG